VKGVEAERAELDRRLVAVARNWRLERMAHVDRNLLRLAAWEILFGGTPPAVAIDEAVELAREFGDDASPRFVNGVLDALVRSAAGPAGPAESARALGPGDARALGPGDARALGPEDSAKAHDPRRRA
jgi:N utilization substance protein B